jgi:hypothetical protein
VADENGSLSFSNDVDQQWLWHSRARAWEETAHLFYHHLHHSAAPKQANEILFPSAWGTMDKEERAAIFFTAWQARRREARNPLLQHIFGPRFHGGIPTEAEIIDGDSHLGPCCGRRSSRGDKCGREQINCFTVNYIALTMRCQKKRGRLRSSRLTRRVTRLDHRFRCGLSIFSPCAGSQMGGRPEDSEIRTHKGRTQKSEPEGPIHGKI